MFDRKLITTILLAAVCLALYAVFPADDRVFQPVVKSIAFLLVIPVLYIRIIVKEDLGKFGIQKGEWRAGVFFGALSLVASLAIVYLAVNYAGFAENYSRVIPASASSRFIYFVFYEIFVVGSFLIFYEFFFRGFVMFSLSRATKIWAILIQAVIFTGFLAITKNLNWQFAPFIIAAFFSGITAYYSRSLIYSFSYSLLFFILADAYIIKIAEQVIK